MIQYLLMDSKIILNKDGKKIKIIGFRNRLKYSTKDIFEIALVGEENLRIDQLCGRLYNSENLINGIIDANEVDVFSFVKTDKVKYINKERL